MNKKPYDCGYTDFHYWRSYQPHYYKPKRVEWADMTEDQAADYRAGWEEARVNDDRKDLNYVGN